MAFSDGIPVYGPECTERPYSVNASLKWPFLREGPSSGCTTIFTGRRYFCANSKSRSSCAGTHITAPVPYSASTKFATQIGTRSPEKGFRANRPVKNPSFSAVAISAAFALACRISLSCESMPAARHAFKQSSKLRMARRNEQRRNAIDCVDPRRENFQSDLGDIGHIETHPRAHRLADPVPLHRQHTLRPSVRKR